MKLKSLNAITFEEEIYDKCQSCLVVFSRKNCHVCAEVIPMIEEVAETYIDSFGFFYVDVEDESDLFKRFSLRGVPQILFFNNGEYQGKLGGLLEEERVVEKIEEVRMG